MFRSVHFPIHISDIVKETESGKRCTVDLDAAKIYFQEFPNNINTSEPDELKPENIWKITQFMIRSKNFFEKTNKLFEESGNGDDFKAVLQAL